MHRRRRRRRIRKGVEVGIICHDPTSSWSRSACWRRSLASRAAILRASTSPNLAWHEGR